MEVDILRTSFKRFVLPWTRVDCRSSQQLGPQLHTLAAGAARFDSLHRPSTHFAPSSPLPPRFPRPTIHRRTHCSCPECLVQKPEKCPLIRQGIMTGPTEFARKVGHADEVRSAKDDDLQKLFERMPADLPFGSTALLRVDPSEHRGQDIVPVLIARKAPSPWSPSDYSRDGMFTQGDVIVWVFDLPQVPECGQGVEYLVPDKLSTDKLRAVPLTCIAGLGQGLRGYMERSPQPTLSESGKQFLLREGVIENARSNVVLLSTNPSSAFKDFQPVRLSEEDLLRAPVAKSMFAIGTVVEQRFKGPVMETGKLLWSRPQTLEATVVLVRTVRESRRHQYKLKWKGDVTKLVVAGVPEIVDEGYVERYRK